MKRRLAWVLGLVAVGGLLVCGAGGTVGALVWNRGQVETIDKVDFANRLAVPPLAPSHLDDQGRRVFDLRAQAGQHDFGSGHQASTWGFNGDYLGPTLRAKRGERVAINIRNDVDEPTTVHWHGMHLPAAMDGGPHQQIEPGGTWSPTWTIDQPAATLWYHPHLHGTTEEHVYRGLAGMFILDDEPSATLDLPGDYGVDDLPIIVQDKKFRGNGELDDRADEGPMGVLGDTIAVNGTVGAYQEVTTQRLRMRLLNASVGRVFNFGFSDDREFALVGTDGGLLGRPYRTKRIQLAPGERAEIVLTVRPAEQVQLRSYPPDLGTNFFSKRFSGGNDSFDVLQLRAGKQLKPSPQLPAKLVDMPRMAESSATKVRTFRLNEHSINGKEMDMGRVDQVVEKDTTEIWQIRNEDGLPHSFHIHDVQFQVLGGDGALGGWKDTVYVRPNSTVRLIMRFTEYTDPNTPYMFHCHMLFHEDHGMMGQFVVVEPGQQAGQPEHHHHDG
jgi:FtsP/CotA-like multicopper oxidase with cupredoxin domain